MKRYWKLFLAYFRMNQSAVCEMSIGRGEWDDFHDYPDDICGLPWHDVRMSCKHCGKRFFI
jgi:hypothetical protein